MCKMSSDHRKCDVENVIHPFLIAGVGWFVAIAREYDVSLVQEGSIVQNYMTTIAWLRTIVFVSFILLSEMESWVCTCSIVF